MKFPKVLTHEFPVGYFEGNLVITTKKECWIGYEIVGFQYDHKSRNKKVQDFKRLVSFFSSLKLETRIMILPRVYSFHEHFDSLKKEIQGPFANFAKAHADDTRDYLVDLLGNEGSNHSQYVFFKLNNIKSWNEVAKTTKDSIIAFFKESKRDIEEIAGFSGIEIYDHEIRTLKGLESQQYNEYRVNSFSNGRSLRRLDEEEIEWLCRRSFWLGIAQPPKSSLFQKKKKEVSNNAIIESGIYINSNKKKMDIVHKNNKKVIRPRQSEFLNLSEGLVELSDKRTIKLTQEYQGDIRSSYCSFLTISDIPDGYWIPGNEWLYQIQEIDFPVSAVINISPIDPETSKRKVANKQLEINEQGNMTAQSGTDFSSELQQAFESAKSLDQVLTNFQFPLLDISIILETHAPDEESLKNQRTWLKSIFEKTDFKVVWPAGDQLQLMQQFIPGADRHLIKEYIHRMTPPEIAASMIGAHKKLGDNEGFFIGFTGNLNKPVFYNPGKAPLVNKSASGSFTGTLGGGKSYAANYIGIYLNSLYGGKGLVIDPKGDREKWKTYLKEFDGELEYVTLNDREEDYGKLDPFGFLEFSDAVKVAQNIITYLADIKIGDDVYDELIDACEELQGINEPSMYKLITVLEGSKNEIGKNLARKCRSFQRAPFGKLIFFDGKLNTIKLDKRVTILQIDSLKLPKRSKAKEDYDIIEMLSVALMYPIGEFAIKFSLSEEFTVTLLDEAWAFMSTQQGAELVDRLIRTGRSLNAAVYVISQNVRDLMDAKNNLGVKFIFRSKDSNEVDDILEFLNLELTEENKEMVRNIQSGAPLMQDIDGNVGIVNIDVIFEHIHLALETTPKKKKGEGGAA
ncbi:ATP-binding protein [Margalitia sp. FSL K6-0131]|uniref:ATP-binding protein n=1 Tax=Margalitia sp. FSL K6-0131 TaxID=2954604 RepID=UPI0030F58AF0